MTAILLLMGIGEFSVSRIADDICANLANKGDLLFSALQYIGHHVMCHTIILVSSYTQHPPVFPFQSNISATTKQCSMVNFEIVNSEKMSDL